jgi:CubicO group peptidase (beta-lactamase class C family)
MLNAKPAVGALFLALLCVSSGKTADSGSRAQDLVRHASKDILSPVKMNLTISGVFRQQKVGINAQTAVLVPDSIFFAPNGTIATMAANGLTLVDVDIDTSTGNRLYSAIFESGVPYTQYYELAPGDFETKVAALDAQGIRLVSLHTYTNTNGEFLYSGVFQQGAEAQLFPGAMTWATFTSTIDANKVTGYFLTNVAVYVSGGQEYFLGVWRSHPGNTNRSAFWVSEWNSFAKGVWSQAGWGKRLVTMAHWEFNGDRKYGGVWLDGTDAYDVVAATDADVFQRKVDELFTKGKMPVRINIEHGYQPPLGLAAAFNDDLDAYAVGYGYGISEEGTTTAVGAFGYARAPWEQNTPGVPMSESTRLDIASVNKAIESAALFKLLEDPNVSQGANLDTPVMKILGAGVLGGGAPGSEVHTVTIRDLLNMNSGLCDGAMQGIFLCVKDGTCGNQHYTDYEGWLACVLQNCTSDPNNHCAAPPFANIYNGTDTGVLRAVIETLSGQQPLDSVLHYKVFLPMGVDVAIELPGEYLNANCGPDLTTPTRPLYYASGQTSGPGDDEQSWNRDETVCGSGGLQMTAAQANTFLQQLLEHQFLLPADLTQLLGVWLIEKLDANSWPVALFDGPGYAKNGGYPIGGNPPQGPTTGIVMVPGLHTEIAVFSNTSLKNTATSMDPQTAAIDGLDRMNSYPLGTFSIVNRNSAAFGPMCFNVSEASTAQNAGIIQWTCGTAPLAPNEQFVQRDLGNGRFMLQAINSGMCVTVRYDDTTPGEIMLQYQCNGLANQQFVFRQTSGVYGNLVVQNSGMCLTVSGGANSIYSGQAIVQEPCAAGQSTQEFMLHPYDIVSVVNQNSTAFGPMCFNVTEASTAQNAAIIQWTCGPEPLTTNMQFRWVDRGNGVFMLQAINSGRCVTVHNDDANPGETMLQYDCNGLTNQQFTWRPTSGGFGNVVAQNSGLCLTVSGGSNSIYSGQPIVQEPCASGNSVQEFILEQQ